MIKTRILPLLLIFATACAGSPKKMYEGDQTDPHALAIVEPGRLQGMMMIRSVDKKSTYSAVNGFLGSVAVIPGVHAFEVEVNHTYGESDAQKPELSIPKGAPHAPLESAKRDTIFAAKLVGTLSTRVSAGKKYRLRIGFDPGSSEKFAPVLWIAEEEEK